MPRGAAGDEGLFSYGQQCRVVRGILGVEPKNISNGDGSLVLPAGTWNNCWQRILLWNLGMAWNSVFRGLRAWHK